MPENDLPSGTRVTWSDPADGYSRTGTVIAAYNRKAWTPAEYTSAAPDAGMTMVRWDNESDPHWEYIGELSRPEPANR
ncbi:MULTISPECIES: hypothetical protein [unclassified Rhodococcus (in: high G+C Gram-positive bacteria)]|jgi:hypothetical protein|uniref:hypothetical protein n=1 Tax=unclassified Rhodococcus (in: high G+C Gram-positive bacteria) TaxID=192944 RepID=UPI0019D18512|nr:hypothetical protein [Rhodococcus sp. KRD162]MDZ7912963.1 hypothetical protein [Rhodococcus sp. (in: high G+C Gram-positive bacteria)]